VIGVKADGNIQVAPLGDNYAATPKDYDNLAQEEASQRMTEKSTKPIHLFKTFEKVHICALAEYLLALLWKQCQESLCLLLTFKSSPHPKKIIYKEGKQNWEDLRHIKWIYYQIFILTPLYLLL
jgi:hypothetical protein